MNIELTKSGLLQVKELLSLARQGYKLMDQKRSILISEIMKYFENARELQERIVRESQRAYEALTLAATLLGIESIEEIAKGAEEKISVEIFERGVLGVPIPTLAIEGDDLESEKFTPFYSAYRTNMALDNAVLSFRKLLKLITFLAEVETTIYRLAKEINITRKRANALEQVIIPDLEKTKKRIESHLEEREREEFFKLKRLKKGR
ncbi:MAG: V-type ATP synthase subunit D [Synergistetes bacterium]|nr:V-type ATP synthase subunit D [Synergistota bacterium]MDW8191741.1 V-type ATP synthase subunit D [Synergistota bacterium]